MIIFYLRGQSDEQRGPILQNALGFSIENGKYEACHYEKLVIE